MNALSTKRKWLIAWLEGLERSRYTGAAQLTLYLNHGTLNRLVVRKTKPKELNREKMPAIGTT
jgi:hypothetical protein